MSNKKALFISVVIFFLWIYIWFTAILPSKISLVGVDFFSYYLGAHALGNSNTKTVYDLRTQLNIQNKLLNSNQNHVLPFKAPLTSTIPYYLLTFFDPLCAYKIFFLFQILLLLLCCYLMIKNFQTDILFTILFAVSPPIIGSLIQGQSSILVFFFTVISILLFRRQKYFLSGIFLSLILLRPQLSLILLFILLIERNKKFLHGLVIGGVVIFLSNNAIYGNGFVKDYINFLIKTETPDYGTHIGASYTLKTVLEVIDSLFKTSFSNLSVFLTIVSVTVISFILLTNRKKLKADFEEELGLAILLGIPLGLHLLTHDLLIIAMPLNILFKRLRGRMPIWVGSLIFFIFIIFSMFNFRVIPGLTLFGIALIIISTILYVREVILKN